jgi:hypothetical protein
MGDRPDGAGSRQFDGGPRHSVTDRLQQRAEQRRRDEELRTNLRQVLATTTGGEVDDETFEKFLADLAVETGALPPLDRVVEAVELAKSVEPAKVGQQIRMLYRRRRPAAVS